MIVLRAVKLYISCTSIEQTLFKKIVTREKVLDLVHLVLGEVAEGKSGFVSHRKHTAEATNMNLFHS